MLNRRGFLGALLGAGVAAAVPAPLPKPLNFSRAAFVWAAQPLDFDMIRTRYLNPAMEGLARDIDARFRYSQRITVADSRRFDPARLPL